MVRGESGLSQMSNEDETVQELRSNKKPRRSYMSAVELKALRTQVIKTILVRLADQLIRPDTGEPIKAATLSRYERGLIPVPQWVAQQVLIIAEAARRYDAQR